MIAAFALYLACSSAAAADGKWALVFAVSDYDLPTIGNLDNTVNDGRTMASALNQMGFEVYYLENAGLAEFNATVEQIVTEQSNAESGVLFFAGHGLQVDGDNYALPADIRPGTDDFLKTQGISIGEVVHDLTQSGVGSLFVILDACRNSPFPDSGASGTGLALVDAPENTIIAYSTAPGELALDGNGPNSPYTAALASAIEGPAQDMRDVLRLVRARVRLATGGQQTPWYIDNSRAPIPIGSEQGGTATEQLELLTYDEVTLDRTAWWTIANSADPRDFEAFIELFPTSDLSETARRQMSEAGAEDLVDFPLMNLDLSIRELEVPNGLQSLITACDILATAGYGGLGLVEPVPHDLINVRAANRACTEAVRNDPENPRLLGLLARVLMLQERYPEALFYNEQATEFGSSNAYGAIAVMYRLGLGTEPDIVRAAENVRTGALAGSAAMRVMMGVYYREGWGVPQSFDEARRWFELAVVSGNKAAMSALGDLHARGQLGDRDPVSALRFYGMAAALDHSDAMNSIGLAYLRGEGVTKNERVGIDYLSKASDLGNPYAALHLGRAFITGDGVEKDGNRALAYFRLSAQRNFLQAYIAIGAEMEKRDALAQAFANYTIARDGGTLVDTRASRDMAGRAQGKLDALLPRMSEAQRTEGLQIATDWIDQYGLLDFNLVNE